MTAKPNWIKGVPTSFPCWVVFSEGNKPTRYEAPFQISGLGWGYWLPAEPRPEPPAREQTLAERDNYSYRQMTENCTLQFGPNTAFVWREALSLERAEVAKIANKALRSLQDKGMNFDEAYIHYEETLKAIAARSQ